MKRLLLATALAGCMIGATAQNVIERPTLKDNWTIGVDGGVTTTIQNSFFKHMRGQFGIHVAKQLTPLVGVGVEGTWNVNTTSSRNWIDGQYVGAFGTLNLTNLFCGFKCEPREFWIDALVGGGWGHQYWVHRGDRNYIAAKGGLNFNFAVTDHFSIAVKPAVIWNIAETGNKVEFNSRRANFELMVGFNYNFGPGFKCAVVPADLSADVDALNARVNALRADLDGTAAALAATTAENASLAAALAECQSKPATVVADTTLNSVRYVFFRIGSANITADQQPNIEMVAQYLKNHPESQVIVKGYASQDGNLEFNEKLATRRAESVKNALVKRYKIKADRIKAEGQGIGHMFSEESWNRVAICTLETK